jgi:hypothetical protein
LIWVNTPAPGSTRVFQRTASSLRGSLCIALLWALVASATAVAPAAAGVSSHVEQPGAKLQDLVAQIEQSPLPLPVHIESEQTDSRLRGDVYSIVEQRFDSVRDALTLAANWCEILPLQTNVKACTHGTDGQDQLLSLYIGRKFYQKPEATHLLPLTFEVPDSSESGLEIALRASQGPLGTRNYVLAVVAVPLTEGRTLIHVSYSYEFGVMSRMAVFGYLKTMGRKKVGFTAVGTDREGRPICVRGVQGIIERNSMRYHLAVQAYLETLDVPETERFERSIERWFDLSSVHRAQLFEMPRDDYLDCKRRERAEQTRLQRALSRPTSRTVAASEPAD